MKNKVIAVEIETAGKVVRIGFVRTSDKEYMLDRKIIINNYGKFYYDDYERLKRALENKSFGMTASVVLRYNIQG